MHDFRATNYKMRIKCERNDYCHSESNYASGFKKQQYLRFLIKSRTISHVFTRVLCDLTSARLLIELYISACIYLSCVTEWLRNINYTTRTKFIQWIFCRVNLIYVHMTFNRELARCECTYRWLHMRISRKTVKFSLSGRHI